ncbi:hypothetical protein IO89_15865 [Epilithonimonas lactis]|uniref:Uncharacterized protein n=1 Tax=Epilithonimonas lactis TaxID=421072 RepID=A0A085B951_9FLAO|nr:hypothetical protein IO89_15865 [Epilithonimonas lactis]
MLKNFVTFLYFTAVIAICIFIFVSVNFIILSNDPLQRNYTKIIIAKIAYKIIIDIIAIMFSYGLFLLISKLTVLKAEKKDIFKLLTLIFTVVSVISLAVFSFVVIR